MKPNHEGGQTFEARELWTVRNFLRQAQLALAKVDERSADTGDSSLFNELAGQFGARRIPYQLLKQNVTGLKEALHEQPPEDDYEAMITETQTILGCMGWGIQYPDSLEPFITSAEQLEEARAMVAQFVGSAATPPAEQA